MKPARQDRHPCRQASRNVRNAPIVRSARHRPAQDAQQAQAAAAATAGINARRQALSIFQGSGIVLDGS